jgi:hypothetical protein
MQAVAFGVLLTATVAAAQTVLIDPAKIADAEKLIETFHGGSRRCEVAPVKPRIDFKLTEGRRFTLVTSDSSLPVPDFRLPSL